MSLKPDGTDARVAKRGQPGPGFVLGAIVHHDEVPVRVVLSADTLNGLLEHLEPVPRWYYD